MYFSYQGVAKQLLGLCTLGENEQRRACIRGALMSSVTSDPLARHGFEICLAVEKDIREERYGFLGQHIEQVHGKTQRQTLCSAILLGPERNACIGFSK